ARDVLRGSALDILPLEHEDELPVPEERHLRRRWRVTREITARPPGRLGVLAGEHGEELARAPGVRDREGRRGAGVARGAAAYGVHHHERRVPGGAERG